MNADGTEKQTLVAYLVAQRAGVLAVVDGLDARALNTSVLPSGWTPLGLVEHLGHAERHWFQEVVTGAAGPLPWPDDGAAPLTTPRAAGEVFAFYAEQCRLSDAVIARTPLSAPPRGRHPEPMDDISDLRGIVLHMIEETARHAGHLDIARELLDGRTGLGPR
ncbi:DinB family protein [Streptomyces sp. NPDC046716]|uniref:DinB family protein n=1 Tax=Streptomyces sp. NPDC046716 TaxID=3157093 RepID=UPI00340A3462